MTLPERLLRLMTHFNIAATLATAAWVLWSGSQIVAGTSDWPAARTAHAGAAVQPVRDTARCAAHADPHGDAAAPATSPLPASGQRAGWQDT